MELDIMATIQQGATIPVAVVCFLVGAWLKKVSFIPDEFIPIILGVIGVVGVLWSGGWIINPENVFGGIFSAALAVYAHQTGKQVFEAITTAKTDKSADGDENV